jgi:hypothetical protein
MIDALVEKSDVASAGGLLHPHNTSAVSELGFIARHRHFLLCLTVIV